MAFLLLLPLIFVAAIEITLFIEVGQRIGALPTLLAIFATGVLGLVLMRSQGLGTLRRAQAAMARQEMPVRELFDGLCILVGGVLLLLPGFLTDALGLLLLLPPVRALLRRGLGHGLVARHHGAYWSADRQASPSRPGRGSDRNPWRAGPVIEGDYREVSPDDSAAGQNGAGHDGAGHDGAGRDEVGPLRPNGHDRDGLGERR